MTGSLAARPWPEVAATLPARPAPGHGRVDLTLAGARHAELGVWFAPWGAFRIADPAGLVVVGQLDDDGASGPPADADSPPYAAVEFVHDLLRPAGVGAALDLARTVAHESVDETGDRVLHVGPPDGEAVLRLVLDGASGLFRRGEHLPAPDELRWELSGWTPDDAPDRALFTVGGAEPAAGGWSLARDDAG